MGQLGITIKVEGSNCVDCAIVIGARECTVGADLCRIFFNRLREGKEIVIMEEDKVIFRAGNVSCSLEIEEGGREEFARRLIGSKMYRLEPIEDAFYYSFRLSKL